MRFCFLPIWRGRIELNGTAVPVVRPRACDELRLALIASLNTGGSPMNRCRRTIFFIDREVQGSLMLRTAVYWLFCLMSVSLMLICWDAYTGPSRRFIDLSTNVFYRYGPGLVASLLLLPIVMMDVVRLSNRFVGPIMRLRKAMKTLSVGQPATPLNFRDDDFWRELANDFNQVSARIAVASLHAPPTEVFEKASGEVELVELVESDCRT
jgi:hypothetical protein